MWEMGWAYKCVPGNCTVRGLLNCNPKETMLSAVNLRLNGQGIGLNRVVDLVDDFVVDDPLEFFDLIER